LSSTTDRRRRGTRGQVLVIFAGGFILVLAIAALVFDVGQNLLDRRTEQNAADAAALAGARWVPGAAAYHGVCASPFSGLPRPVEAACQVAKDNGFENGVGGKTVRVDIPPIAPSSFSGLADHIQVTVNASRPSFFQGVLGVAVQRTGAMGVATNGSDIPLPYSLLALAPHACGENKITGSPGSAVSTNGTVHVDSDCSSALQLSGNGVLNAPECDVVGQIQVSGGAMNNCTSAPTGILASGDPLRNLPPPPQPGAPLSVLPLDAVPGPIPDACPGGSSPATDVAPAACQFSAGGMAGKSYRLYPGNYPGGIRTSKATLYLSPGIYWLGGGGLSVQTDGRLISKAIGDDTGLTPSGGVLLYDTADPDPTVMTGCVSVPTGPGCFGAISLNGGPGAAVALRPIESGYYKNMVIFVDRTQSISGDEIFLNGSDSTLDISGTIYVPNGSVRFNGSDTYASVSAQIICWTFQVNGSGAGLTLNYDPDQVFHLRGTGLVE
jgi:Flp pilus assembly protein TadG